MYNCYWKGMYTALDIVFEWMYLCIYAYLNGVGSIRVLDACLYVCDANQWCRSQLQIRRIRFLWIARSGIPAFHQLRYIHTYIRIHDVLSICDYFLADEISESRQVGTICSGSVAGCLIKGIHYMSTSAHSNVVNVCMYVWMRVYARDLLVYGRRACAAIRRRTRRGRPY